MGASHGGTNAEFPRFVVACAKHSSTVWITTDCYGIPLQAGIIAGFNGCVEAVHVDVGNFSHSG
jgi:hypothetical protein